MSGPSLHEISGIFFLWVVASLMVVYYSSALFKVPQPELLTGGHCDVIIGGVLSLDAAMLPGKVMFLKEHL